MLAKFLCLLGLVAVLGGCAHDIYPERIDAVHEVYPGGLVGTDYDAAPIESKAESIIPAGYADIYEVVRRSMAQNQWNTQREDAKSGQLLATKITREQAWNIGMTDRHYFFAVSVSELGPKKTQIRVTAKTQRRCAHTGPMGRTVMAVSTLGLSEGKESFGMVGDETYQCKEVMSKARWALDVRGELNQLMVFVRNNMIAAGLM